MIDSLTDARAETCGGTGCDRSLPDAPAIVYRTSAGERRAYECVCGAVTVTVAATGED